MPILETLLVATAVGCGKFLFRRYASRAAKPLDGTPDSATAGVLEGLAGAAGEGVASGLGDLVKERLKKADDQRRATREFEELGERVVEGLRKDLQGLHANVPDDRWERVHEWVNLALAGNLTADFVVRNRVDSVKLFEALRAVPLNVPGPVTDDDRALYHSTLREVARHLAAAASKLPKFDEANARASLDLLASLRTDFDTVLDDVRTIREHVERAQGPGAHDEFETDYRQRVVQRLDYVELFGVALAEELSRTRLTDAYVTLSLTNTRDDGEDDDAEADPEADDADAGNLSTDVALDTLLPETGRLLVRGAAGAGKTTFMKWAAITAARMTPSQRDWHDRRGFERGPDGIRLRSDDELARDDRDWRPRVPFIVFLRHCAGGKLPTPQEFPKLLSSALGDPPPNWVRDILKAGRGLVLLDGVDEIPHASRTELRRSLADLVQAYPASYFVVTTRPEAVDPAWLDDLGFREAEVVPMSPEDRDGFIRRWYEVVARGRRQPAIRDKAEQLIADLGTAPWLVRLMTNPMLCAMTCAQYLANRDKLPESLRDMCETLCKVLLHQLDLERKIDLSQFPHPYPEMSYVQKKAVMRQAAYSFVMNGRSALPEPDVVQAVGLALKRIPDREAAEAEVVFRCMLERSGMIRESTPEDAATGTPATIEFLHNTFKEFLAGEQIADENHYPLLLSKLDDEAWRRVGLFAFAAGTAAFQNALLRGVFDSIPEKMPKASKKRAPVETETARARAIFALQCRALATQCDEAVKARLNDVAAQVVPPRTLTDAAWLAAAGNVVVPHLKYQPRVGGGTNRLRSDLETDRNTGGSS